MIVKLHVKSAFLFVLWAGIAGCSSAPDAVTGTGDPTPTGTGDPAPATFWDLIRTIDGLRSDAFPHIVVDGGNSVYIAGSADGGQAFLTKYDAEGNQVWLRKFAGSGSESVKAVGIDPVGRIYLVGDAYSGPRDGGCFLALYDAGGVLLRMQLVGVSGPNTVTGGCVAATDPSGNFYVGGSVTVVSDVSTDLFLAKYTKDGTQLWARVFGSAPGKWNDDGLGAVAVDARGGVYVAGGTVGSFDGITTCELACLVVLKFDEDGNRLWSRQYASSEGSFGLGSIAEAVADPDGGVYVCGLSIDWRSNSFFGNTNAFVARYSADGTRMWTRTLDGGDYDVGNGVAVDRRGVYVVGLTNASSTPGREITEPRQFAHEGFLAMLSRDGTLKSVRLLSGTLGAWATGVAIAGNGDLYVTGNFDVAGQYTGAAMFARHHGAMP